MKKLFFRLLPVLAALLCLTACGKEAEPNVQWEVTAVLPHSGLGDLGCNDQIYLGICCIREQLDCRVVERRPSGIAEGIEMAGQWMQQAPRKGQHRLLILCDEGYADAVRQQGWTNTDESAILQLDCQDAELDIYTRNMPLYGACFAVGRLCKETLEGTGKHAALVMANPHDTSIGSGKEGFLEGAQMEGVETDVYYLQEQAGSGYTEPSDLYHLCFDIAPQTGFLLPLAGGSNKGVYEYGRESHSHVIWTCAVGSDLSYLSYTAAYGIMQYADLLLLDFTRRWREQQPNEKHLTCGLASGYVRVDVNTLFDDQSAFEAIINDATERENRRYSAE